MDPAAVDAQMDKVLARAGEFFMKKSPVHLAAEALAQRFGELGIPYAIAGALAVGFHGLVRVTDDVDVLLTRDGLERFKSAWRGRGYVDLFAGSRAMRDTQHDVKIDFLIAGDYPGDGKPKPVTFPDPTTAGIPGERFRVLELDRLLELKIASGMSAPHRMQDLADTLRIVHIRRLPREHADRLDPYVRDKFDELWRAAQHADEDY